MTKPNLASELSGTPSKKAEPFSLKLTLPGLPKMSNQLLRGHWRVKHAHALRWKLAVSLACHGFKPRQPLISAALTCTRVSSSEPDFDGLVSGFKHLIDGLVECGVLATDKPSCIGQPKFEWRKCAPRGGHVLIEVTETTKEQVK